MTEIDTLRVQRMVLRGAIETARHSLTTLHGLTACDSTIAWYRAWEDGADADGAWDAFTDSTWTIDEAATLKALDDALAETADLCHVRVCETCRSYRPGHIDNCLRAHTVPCPGWEAAK